MAIVLRLTKGSQLTFAELDGNFSDLDGRVTTNTNSINTINASISTLNTNVSGNDSDILSLQTDQNAIDTRLIAAEGELANVTMTSTEADFGNRIVKFANTVDSAALLPTASTVPGAVFRVANEFSGNRLRYSNGSTYRILPTNLTQISNGAGDTLLLDSDVTINFAGGNGINVNKINNNRFEFVSAPESTFTVGKASADSGYSFAPDPTGQGFFIDSAINPTLYLNRGQKYNFVLAAASEPMYIKTAATTGTGDQYTKGVTGNGIQFGTLTFTPTMDADSALFYQSSVTSGYGGIIKVIT